MYKIVVPVETHDNQNHCRCLLLALLFYTKFNKRKSIIHFVLQVVCSTYCSNTECNLTWKLRQIHKVKTPNMKFCRSSFWNMTLTWHTNHPHFTQCFEDTVLTGIPCLILWLGFPFWLGWICKQNQRPPQRAKIYTLITKLIGNLIDYKVL